jgi:type VI secretion system protein VasI
MQACGTPVAVQPTVDINKSINATQTAAAIIPTASTGKWKTEISTSAMDDSQTVVMKLPAENEIQGWLDPVLPVLFVRCKEHKLDVYVYTDTTEVESDIDHSTVRIRFDKIEPGTLKMSHSSDDTALFFEDKESAFKLFLITSTMLFEFTPFNAPPVQATFDLRGFSEAVKPLAKACNITITKQ